MSNVARRHLAACLSVLLLLTAATQAMEIQKYDQMSKEDQAEYFGVLLQGAEQVLKEQGRPADVQKVEKLFSTTMPGDEDILGVIEFESNLAILRDEDAKNALAHPNDPRLEIEDAMVAILHMNAIELPDSFFRLAGLKNFHPKSKIPAQDHTKK
jgi:hypothetical protein